MSSLPNIHQERPIRHHAAVVCLVLLGLVAAAPAQAQTQRCEAPPGRSGVEQYCESLPDAGGPQGGDREGSGRGVDRRTAGRLRSAGEEGEALLSLVGGAAASGDADGSGSGSGDSGSGSKPADGAEDGGSSDGGGASAGTQEADEGDEPSDNVLTALQSSVEDGPTLTNAFGWLLLAIAIGCFALAWLVWRRRESPDADPGSDAS